MFTRSIIKSLYLIAVAFLAATRTFAVTISVDAVNLKDEVGNLMPVDGLVLLVASTTNDTFTPPSPTAFVLGDDVIIKKWDLGGTGQPGLLSDLVDSLPFTGNWDNGDPLRLYWYPTLTLGATEPGEGTPYGSYRSDTPLDGGVPWVTPSEASAINLKFLTEEVGGSNPANAGNASFTVTPLSTVAGRLVFYNDSAWDGDAGASVNDDLAIATDKSALLPDGTATFANYTSYRRGLNGIMVDIANLAGVPTASDFSFKSGNDNTPSGWATAPDPVNISIRPGEGVGGSDRVTLIWNNNNLDGVVDANEAVTNHWLEVTVQATANTGLASDDVFYFGNAPGEAGDSPSDANVLVNDPLQILNHLAVGVAVDNRFDIDRDGSVLVNDALFSLNHLIAGAAALQLIDLSGMSSTTLLDTSALIYADRIGLLTAAQTTGILSSDLRTKLLAVERLSGGTMRYVLEWPGPVPVRVWQKADLSEAHWDLVPETSVQAPRAGLLTVELPAEPVEQSRFFRLEAVGQ